MGVRRIAASAFAVVATLLGAVAATTPAHASPSDWGDRTTRCNPGEICFTYYFGGTHTTGIRHFYYDSDHRYTTFDTGTRLYGNSAGFRNLDTQCNVWVWTIENGRWMTYGGYVPTELYRYPNGTTTYAPFRVVDINRNYGHTRCQGTTAPIGK
jgi:hypothetical protein